MVVIKLKEVIYIKKSINEYADIIREKVLSYIDRDRSQSDEEIFDIIERLVNDLGRDVYLRNDEKTKLTRTVFYSLRKLDVLQEILEDDRVTEIMINGPDEIFIEKDGAIIRYPKHFSSAERLENIIQQIVSRMNRIVNESTPIVDVRLEDGSRVNAVLKPVAINGPILTIRKFPKSAITLERLIEIGSVTREVVDMLTGLVRAGYNIFISGGTGSGKTTFLNALSNAIPSDERVITVEDSAELQIQGVANLVRLESRNANLEGKNEVTIRDLLKSALRMRPDRIVLGEVRDAAACELLTAMGTGHDGSLSTGHANSPHDMLSRLETLVLTGMDIPLAAVRAQIASSIDIVIQLARLRDKSRKVINIEEISGIEHGEIVLNSLYKYIETGTDGAGRIQGSLVWTGNRLKHQGKLERSGVEIAYD